MVRGRNRPAWAPVERELITVPGMAGAYLSGSKKQVRVISVPVYLESESIYDLQKVKEDLAEWLIYDEVKTLEFKDEPDRVYYALVDGGLDLNELFRWGQGVITFICPDAYKYGPEQTLDLSDISTIENKGTAEADPIFELTAKKKATFAMISNGDDENAEYNLIGRPADIDEQIVDEKTPIFDELGDTIPAWDIPVLGSVGGFSSDSNGIFVNSYGTGSGWHGPALMREIDPIDDFEIEFFVRIRTESARQTFRLSTNFYDENNDELGMMRLWNKSTNQINKVVEARIGPYVGQFENYLISSRNYNWIGQRVYNGIIRVTRKGNVYTFYAAHITQRGNHIESITERYVDSANEFAGKLKFIQIDAAIYGDTPSPNALSIPRVRVTQHNQVLVDETPYILYPGDIVTLDHKDDDILVNGEPRSDLKNFGGSFFKLAKGENMLIVTPEDTFDTQVTLRDKYL